MSRSIFSDYSQRFGVGHSRCHESAGVSGIFQAGGQGRDSEQVKDLPARLVDEIVVKSRACIQPYFIPPGVRTPFGSRRGTGIEPACQLFTSTLVLKTRGPTRRPD